MKAPDSRQATLAAHTLVAVGAILLVSTNPAFKDATGAGDLVGLEKVTEGTYDNGRWQEGRWLNGDEIHQGRQVMLVTGDFTMQRVKLYRYK